MPILRLSNNFSSNIATKVNKIKLAHQNEADLFVRNNEHFNLIYINACQILQKHNFVIIKNIGFNKEKTIFEAFLKMFGNFYGTVEYTDLRINCKYTGCSYSPIELHNDDAIDLDTQPLYGFIQILTEDKLLQVKNGIVKIDTLVEHLSLYDEEFLEALYTVKIPMLSYGINYDGENKSKIEICEPILYRQNNETMVRFDISRVKYFYWENNIQQSKEEKILIDKFLSYCNKFRQEYILEAGDVLIHNNKKCLHDRSECSLELNEDGSIDSREIFVSFVRG